MSHRIRIAGVLFAACLALAPAHARAQQATAEDIDRLLQVMDMASMMDDMMQQMLSAQDAMINEAFGDTLSDSDRARMSAVRARTNALVRKRMSWATLEPIFRRVYIQLFTKEEVDAMTAFYANPVGASILRKSPQAVAMSMQEMQPLMQQLMQELQADLQEQARKRKQ